MTKSQLDELIKSHTIGKALVPLSFEIKDTDNTMWVRLRIDPERFLPSIFEGDWAILNKHPSAGSIRIIKSLTGTDGISRLLARQGNHIYAYPWIS
jgi:hypothetical protein